MQDEIARAKAAEDKLSASMVYDRDGSERIIGTMDGYVVYRRCLCINKAIKTSVVKEIFTFDKPIFMINIFGTAYTETYTFPINYNYNDFISAAFINPDKKTVCVGVFPHTDYSAVINVWIDYVYEKE